MRIARLPFLAILCALLTVGIAGAAEPTRLPGARLDKSSEADPRDRRTEWSKASREELGREAARHLGVVWAGIETARVNADALKAMTAAADLHNSAHDRPLVEAVRVALPIAERHLDTLRGMTQGQPLAEKVEAIQQVIDRARAVADELSGSLEDHALMQRNATRLQEALRGATKGVETLARSLGAPLELGARG